MRKVEVLLRSPSGILQQVFKLDAQLQQSADQQRHLKSAVQLHQPGDRNQQWLGVADLMKAEAQEAANATLDKFAARAKKIARITPDRVIREGDTAEEIVKLIDEDADIGILVLAAGTGKEGPGPLVSSLAKTAGTFPIPVAVVPGHLSDEDIDASS